MTDDKIALREMLEKGSDATFLREMHQAVRTALAKASA